MSLIVWLPLNGSLKNQGLNGMTFSLSGGSAITTDSAGKIGSCYKRTAQDGNRIRSSSTVNLSGDISMCCWAYVSATTGDTANGLVTNHDHSASTGVGITVKQISSSDYRMSCNTRTGSGRTYMTYYGTTNIKDSWHHLALTYNKTAKELKLLVDGTCEYTLSNYTNSSKADYIDIFSWSTGTNSTDYRPSCKLNDVRIYDHCLTPQEVKEISKGLVCHYTLGSADVYEATTNIASSLTPANVGGWSGTTITKLGNNFYHFKSTYTNSAYWNTFVYTLPSDCANQTITFSTIIRNITTSNINTNQTWIYIGKGNDGQYPTHGTISFHFSELKENQLLKWTGTLDNSNRYLVIEVYSYTTNTSQAGVVEFDLSAIQIEKKNHITQYVDGTRSPGLVYDSSGYCRNASISGTLTPGSSPRYNQGLDGFAAGNRIVMNNALQALDKCTYSFWCKGSGFPFWGNNNSLIMQFQTNEIKIYATNTAGTTYGWSSKNFNHNTTDWYHIAVVYNGSNVKVYVNGTDSGHSLDVSGSLQSVIQSFGGWESNYYWTGSMSDIRIYATALSADDISDLYSLGAQIS